MTPMFKGALWLALIFALFLGFKKAHAGQQIPDGTVSIGQVTFCKDLKSAREVAKVYKTDKLSATLRKLSAQKKCGWYEGAFIILKKVDEVNGVEIYESDWSPPGHAFMFQSVHEPDPAKMT